MMIRNQLTRAPSEVQHTRQSRGEGRGNARRPNFLLGWSVKDWRPSPPCDSTEDGGEQEQRRGQHTGQSIAFDLG